MGKIHEDNFWYKLLRPYVDFCTYMSYGRAEIVGRDNIPKDAAVIFTPNHCNTLMDALVVLRARRGATVFGTRADLFREPFANKALRFLKMLPMPRMRDGIREVVGNFRTNEEVIDSIRENIPFCAFPEGTHRTKHSLLKVKKGVARIARQATESIPKHVYIVPVGLEYGDYFRFQSSSLVNYGKAIDVTAFHLEHPELSEAEFYQSICQQLSEAMSKLITFIPDDEDYEAKWPLIKAIVAPLRGTPKKRLELNRAAAAKVEEIWRNETLRDVIKEKSLRFEADRRSAGISTHSFGFRKPVLRFCFKTMLLTALLPLAAALSVGAFPMLLLTGILISQIKDKAFSNSIRFLSYLGLLLPLSLIWAVFSLLKLGVFCCAAGIAVLIIAYPFVFRYREALRVCISDFRLMSNKKLRRGFEEIRDAVK